MISVLFVFQYFTTPIFTIFILSLLGINVFKITIFSISFWSFLLFGYIGYIALFFEWDTYRASIGINDRSLIFEAYFYSSISLVIFSFSYVFIKKILPSKLFVKKIVTNLTKKEYISILMLFVLSTLVFILYIVKLPAVPIIEQIKGASKTEVKVLRSLATNDFTGKLHYYSLFFDTIFCFILFTFFSHYLKNKNRKNFIFFLGIFIIIVFAAIVPTHKAPIIWIIIGLGLVYLISSNITLKMGNIIKISIPLLMSLYMMYKYFMGMKDRGTLEILTSIFSRAFTGQITPAYFYVELFPNTIDFLGGRSLPNPGGIFPWEYYRLTVEVMNHKFPNLSTLGIVGSAPTSYWGEAYANFGFLGILISSIYIAALLVIFECSFNYFPKNPINIGLYVAIILQFKNIATTGISSYIFNLDLFLLIFIIIIYNFFIREST